VELLKRFGVPSFQALKLPAGCTSLLSAVAAQDELAAALTGYDDAWDCGAVPYGDVLRVVQQALGNMQHSTRGKSRTTAEGMCTCAGYRDTETAAAVDHQLLTVATAVDCQWQSFSFHFIQNGLLVGSILRSGCSL
jgi:hypothetical protein